MASKRSPISGDLLLSLAALSIPAKSPFSVIFSWSPSASSPTAYDISADGRRFPLTGYLDPPKQPITRLDVVLNWFER